MLRSENLIPLNSGAYQARSAIGNYQVCENLFPEANPDDTDPDVAVTHYPREGERFLSAPPAPGLGRGIFTLSNGNLFGVVGNSAYFIDRNWAWTLLGQIADISTPVSMSDNGVSAVLVDGTPSGYVITLATNAFAPLVDGTGTFVGSRRVDFADTFLTFAAPGTNNWYVSLSDTVTFNALVQASKDSNADPIQTLAFNLRQAWLLGTQSSEVWYLAGSTPFPYQEWPNVFIPYGCAAPYSLVQADVTLFWMAQNLQGQALALKTSDNGYGVEQISTQALEYEWSTYPIISDCIGSTFQQGGHAFVVFHFPTADISWGYDLSTKQWHRRTFIDQNGVKHRERVSFYASVGASGGYPKTIVGQNWQNGQIYALDPKVYTDNGVPIVCRRTFPHIMKDMHEITHRAFVADFETGGAVGSSDALLGNDFNKDYGPDFGPLGLAAIQSGQFNLSMRYSNNGGASFGNFRQKGLITSGNYRSMMRWRGLGMARDRVYELLWSFPGPSALQGAYVEPMEHGA